MKFSTRIPKVLLVGFCSIFTGLGGLTAAVLLTVSSTALAQTVLEEIVVTATRRDRGLQDVPLSITAISGDDIRSMGVTNSRGLESITPGLNVQGGFASSSPQWNIRGLGSNGFSIADVGGVGIYIDDVYINSNAAQGVYMFDTERVEVLRGPQGTLFGSNTTGGAIQFVSKRPTGEFDAEGSLTIGKFAQQKFEGAINIPISDKFAVRAAYFSDENEGVAYNAFRREDAAITDLQAWRLSAAYDASDNLEFIARAWGSRNTGDEFITYNLGGLDPNDFANFTECSQQRIAAFECVDSFGYNERATHSDFWTFEADQKNLALITTVGGSLVVNWDVGDVAITSITAFNKLDRALTDNIDSSREPYYTEEYGSYVDQYSQEIRIASSGDSRLQWIVGGFYLDEEGYDSYLFSFPPGSQWREFDMESTSASLFGEATYEMTDRLSLTGGLRFSRETKDAINYYANEYEYPLDPVTGAQTFRANEYTSEAFIRANETAVTVPTTSRGETYEEVSGRVILDYQFSDQIKGYALFSRGFRGGRFNPFAFNVPDFGFVNPEFVDSYEAGVKSTFWDDKARLNISAFYNDYTDIQLTTLVGLNFQLTNASEATTSGAEIELTVQPADQLFGYFGLALLDAEYDVFMSSSGDLSGNELESAPSVTFNGLIRYDIPVSGDYIVSLQTDFAYKGENYQDFTNQFASLQDDYWLTNASITFGPSDGRFGIQAWVRNIGETEYTTNYDNLLPELVGLTKGDPLTAGVTFSLRMK